MCVRPYLREASFMGKIEQSGTAKRSSEAP
jgi:hypothetical protein